MIDPDLEQRLEQAAGQLGRVALAVARGEAVARISRTLREVEIADVTEADDGAGSRVRVNRWMLDEGAGFASRGGVPARAARAPAPERGILDARPSLALAQLGLMER